VEDCRHGREDPGRLIPLRSALQASGSEILLLAPPHELLLGGNLSERNVAGVIHWAIGAESEQPGRSESSSRGS
jgi:hypothetical protein